MVSKRDLKIQAKKRAIFFAAEDRRLKEEAKVFKAEKLARERREGRRAKVRKKIGGIIFRGIDKGLRRPIPKRPRITDSQIQAILARRRASRIGN